MNPKIHQRLDKRIYQKICVVHHAYFPGNMAHTRQIVAMLEAISRITGDLEFFLPRTGLRPKSFDLKTHLLQVYGSACNFREKFIRVFPFWDDLRGGLHRRIYRFMALRVNSFLFTINVLMRIDIYRADLIYTRHLLFAFIASFLPNLQKRFIVELHDIGDSVWERIKIGRLLRSEARIGVISKGVMKLAEIMVPGSGYKIVLVPDAVGERFSNSIRPKSAAREQLGVETADHIITYCGSLHKLCAPETMIRAFKRFHSPSCKFWIIGGSENQIQYLRQSLIGYSNNNIFFWGHKPHTEIPLYLSASDILVVSYAGWHKRAVELSSPLKVFEYMVAGKAIVAPRVPAIKEILRDEETALFYRVEDEQDLARCLRLLIADPSLVARLGENARKEGMAWSWIKRAEKLFS
jgi:glycosyltransferase involved in cell wall biosynthesis